MLLLHKIKILLVAGIALQSSAQTIEIYNKLNHKTFISIAGFYGSETFSITDSMEVRKKGSYNVENYAGYLRLTAHTISTKDFICNNENVKITIYQDSSISVNSPENEVLKKLKQSKQTMEDSIQQLIINQSYVHEEQAAYYDSLIRDKKLFYLKQMQNVCEENRTTYAVKTTCYFVNRLIKETKDMSNTSEYFDGIDWQDERLVNTTFLPNVYMGYLTNHTEFDEKGFTTSVDRILDYAKQNDVLYEMSLNYLLKLFNTVGPEIIYEYLLDNYYFKESCGEVTYHDENIEAYSRLRTGNRIPNEKYHDKRSQTTIDVTGLLSKEVNLLFFWHTECPFCRSMLETIQSAFNEHNNQISITGFSLDSSSDTLKTFEENRQLSFTSYCDEMLWASEFVKSFRINKTPTVYFINGDGIILGKTSEEGRILPLINQFLESH